MKKKLQLIYIEWQDAFSASGWHDKKEIKRFIKGYCIIKQVGWILKEDKKQITLAARAEELSYISNNQFGNLQKIPKTWIKKRVNLSKYIK